MKRYKVRVEYRTEYMVEVEAENKKEADDLAVQECQTEQPYENVLVDTEIIEEEDIE